MKSQPEKSVSPACTVPNGCLVIIGGAEGSDKSGGQEGAPAPVPPVLVSFVACCKTKHPHIEVITTAGDEDIEGTFKSYAACFTALGAKVVGHIHHNSREELEDEHLDERIRKANGIFITGGDQLKLTSVYGGSSFLTAIKKAYLFDGLVVGGTSAGAMALSTPMIFGGAGEEEMIAAGVKVTTGFEFLKDVCIDTHFVHRGRFVRMAQVIATNPASIGIGIEEATAVVVTDGLKGTVVGNGVIIIIDGVSSRSTNVVHYGDDCKITIRDLRVSILSDGETFEIPQRNPPHT